MSKQYWCVVDQNNDIADGCIYLLRGEGFAHESAVMLSSATGDLHRVVRVTIEIEEGRDDDS